MGENAASGQVAAQNRWRCCCCYTASLQTVSRVWSWQFAINRPANGNPSLLHILPHFIIVVIFYRRCRCKPQTPEYSTRIRNEYSPLFIPAVFFHTNSTCLFCHKHSCKVYSVLDCLQLKRASFFCGTKYAKLISTFMNLPGYCY